MITNSIKYRWLAAAGILAVALVGGIALAGARCGGGGGGGFRGGGGSARPSFSSSGSIRYSAPRQTPSPSISRPVAPATRPAAPITRPAAPITRPAAPVARPTPPAAAQRPAFSQPGSGSIGQPGTPSYRPPNYGSIINSGGPGGIQSGSITTPGGSTIGGIKGPGGGGAVGIVGSGGGAAVEGGKLVLDGKNGMMLCKTEIEAPAASETPAMPASPPASWLTYHLAHPGPGNAMPGDPNCAFFWKGRYHLHYIYKNKTGFVFAHVSSADLVHWTWHPTTLTPRKTGHGMFSGTGFITKEGKPAIIYHGQGAGRNQLAFALDDKLEQWTKPVAIMPKEASGEDSKVRQWDPDCWLNGDTYYGISGGGPPHLMKSSDLKTWVSLGLLMHDDMPTTLGVKANEDVSCANMFKIGNKWMLLCISHKLGCRYYLGDFKNEKYLPEFHAMMNWQGWEFFAPESVLTPDGRRVMWAWCLLKNLPIQSGIQSLPRELSLPEDGVLRIRPLRELETLRHDEKCEANIIVTSDSVHKLKDIAGDTIEFQATFRPTQARQFGVQVYCDRDGNGGFPITVEPASSTLTLGTMKVPFAIKPGEDVTLRVFLDKNMIEVFANDRQAAVAPHKYASENLGVSLFSKGGAVEVKQVKGWKMRSIYAGQ